MAAVGYTAANAFLRASIAVDPYWVSCVKAAPTIIIFAPWLLLRIVRVQRLLPPAKAFAMLVAAAVLGQVGGNVVFQWALGVVGIALTVPLCLGAMIITGAWLGWATLKEPITARTLLSIVLLVSAIGILCLGAEAAHASLEQAASHDFWHIALGVAAACFSGFSYALLGVAIRNAAQQGCPAVTTLMTVGLAGVVVLWPLCIYRIGVTEMWATDAAAMTRMLLAGVANAIAFVSLAKSLEILGVIYVNALNATQAAMAALVGVIYFSEPLSMWLAIGVGLTAWGLVLMKRADSPLDDFSKPDTSR